MQQISNKTLTFLLLIAIVVSITGTIISINRVNQLLRIPTRIPIIGMAGSGTGMVNVTISALTSITATDTLIQFGSCSPNTTIGSNLSSNESGWGNLGVCTAATYSAPDNLTIKNDGNKNINVTVQTSSLAKTFIGGSTGGAGQAEMWFSVRNASDKPGCYNQTGKTTPTGFDGTKGMQWDWKNFSSTSAYLTCSNLTYSTNANSFYLFAKLFLPANAPAGANRTTTLTFTGVDW